MALFFFRKTGEKMAATRLIAVHINKGKTAAQSLADRLDYSHNPIKTNDGEFVTGYECDPRTAWEEFLLTKREYEQKIGRQQKGDVLAYQIRQSFKPGEITPEEANKLGYELAMRFTKGKHAFTVSTHTDKAHIHNHIYFNSTTLDGTRKFKNFWFSGIALQRISDLICLENGLSVIEKRTYRDRTKHTEYPKRETFRDSICAAIDTILDEKPKDFEALLKLLEQAGYECKRGKNVAVRGKGQKRFIRFRSLGEGYTQEEIIAAISGKSQHKSKTKKKSVQDSQKLNLILDIQEKMTQKGPGYQRWATVYNLKQMAKTLLFLRDHNVESLEELREKVNTSVERFSSLSDEIKSTEAQIAEILVLKKHIINYSKTREVYVEYRKAGYSKKFFEEHREAITIHKAAKQAFDELGLKKIPRIKDLNAECYNLMSEKKKKNSEYYELKSSMQELLKAQKNVEMFLAAEQNQAEKEKQKQQNR